MKTRINNNGIDRNELKDIGKVGEDVAARFVEAKGFRILARNYNVRWVGEIDIIATREDYLHFIEVKSVRENGLKNRRREDTYNPSDNIHRKKIKRIANTAAVFLMKYVAANTYTAWYIDAILIRIDENRKKAHVRFIQNIGAD